MSGLMRLANSTRKCRVVCSGRCPNYCGGSLGSIRSLCNDHAGQLLDKCGRLGCNAAVCGILVGRNFLSGPLQGSVLFFSLKPKFGPSHSLRKRQFQWSELIQLLIQFADRIASSQLTSNINSLADANQSEVVPLPQKNCRSLHYAPPLRHCIRGRHPRPMKRPLPEIWQPRNLWSDVNRSLSFGVVPTVLLDGSGGRALEKS